jgi:hypothetical protein
MENGSIVDRAVLRSQERWELYKLEKEAWNCDAVAVCDRNIGDVDVKRWV